MHLFAEHHTRPGRIPNVPIMPEVKPASPVRLISRSNMYQCMNLIGGVALRRVPGAGDPRTYSLHTKINTLLTF